MKFIYKDKPNTFQSELQYYCNGRNFNAVLKYRSQVRSGVPSSEKIMASLQTLHSLIRAAPVTAFGALLTSELISTKEDLHCTHRIRSRFEMKLLLILGALASVAFSIPVGE